MTNITIHDMGDTLITLLRGVDRNKVGPWMLHRDVWKGKWFKSKWYQFWKPRHWYRKGIQELKDGVYNL